jgi:hypothetical protein
VNRAADRCFQSAASRAAEFLLLRRLTFVFAPESREQEELKWMMHKLANLSSPPLHRFLHFCSNFHFTNAPFVIKAFSLASPA